MSLSFVTKVLGWSRYARDTSITSKIVGRGLGKDVALITDGHFSGATVGCGDTFLQKAAEGGNIAD